MSDAFAPLTDFHGVVRLFPLPNFVLFPHALQPLHIFEPRYRQLTADALAGDRLITMALPQAGWEADYAGAPALHPVVTLGRIVAEQALEDGRYNLLLRGLARLRLTNELPAPTLYRQATAELLLEVPAPALFPEAAQRHRLLAALEPWLAGNGTVVEQFRKLVRSDLPLGILCDLIAFALPLDIDFKQALLEDLSVANRCRRLLEHLQAGKANPRPFPPEFSEN